VEILITQELGLRFQILRKQQNLSQEKFALKIDMDRTYYASVESGARNVSIVNIKKITDGLGISLGELFKDMQEVKNGLSQQRTYLPNRKIRISLE